MCERAPFFVVVFRVGIQQNGCIHNIRETWPEHVKLPLEACGKWIHLL
jgi:hypothetical protein